MKNQRLKSWFGSKNDKLFFLMAVHTTEVKFFPSTTKRCANESFSCRLESKLKKKVSEVRKKKKLWFRLSNWVNT